MLEYRLPLLVLKDVELDGVNVPGMLLDTRDNPSTSCTAASPGARDCERDSAGEWVDATARFSPPPWSDEADVNSVLSVKADFDRLGLRDEALPNRKMLFHDGDVGDGRVAAAEDGPAAVAEPLEVRELCTLEFPRKEAFPSSVTRAAIRIRI